MKKALTFIVVFLLLLVGAFFAIGIAVPEYGYTASVEVDRPVADSWKFFMDESKAKSWIRGLKSMELISGQPRTRGAKFRMEFEDDGRNVVMTETMTDVVENEKFDFVLENEVMYSENKVRFTDLGGRTKIEQTTKVRGGNAFWRSLFALMKPTFQNNAQEMLGNLKKGIESSR